MLNQLWFQYVYENQTYTSLSKRYDVSPKTIKRKLDYIVVNKPVLKPRKTVIIMDTSYFRRNFGVMVFRDHYTKQNLFWKYVKYETIAEYKSGIDYLKALGWDILGIVCDGRRGIFSSFDNFPIQMCQRHQAAIIRRYITQNPRLEAGKELNKIMLRLTKSQKNEFIQLTDVILGALAYDLNGYTTSEYKLMMSNCLKNVTLKEFEGNRKIHVHKWNPKQ